MLLPLMSALARTCLIMELVAIISASSAVFRSLVASLAALWAACCAW
jgi:hypothetical protein